MSEATSLLSAMSDPKGAQARIDALKEAAAAYRDEVARAARAVEALAAREAAINQREAAVSTREAEVSAREMAVAERERVVGTKAQAISEFREYLHSQ